MPRNYGHLRDRHDPTRIQIDLTHPMLASHTSTKLPTSINLITNTTLPKCQRPYDQGHLGSCTANAIAFAYAFDEIKQNNNCEFMPSRLFIYYNERKVENSIDNDAGAQLCDGAKILNEIGVCEENIWPYDCPKFTVQPTEQCYSEATHFRTTKFTNIKMPKNHSVFLSALKSALSNNSPIVFGFTVYESFESSETETTGIMPLPSMNENVLGGHAVVLVGYDDNFVWDTQHNMKGVFLVRNSWGTKWGRPPTFDNEFGKDTINGYFLMPYEFLTPDYCSDFYVMDSVTNPKQAEVPEYNNTDPLSPDNINLDPGSNSGGVVNPN